MAETTDLNALVARNIGDIEAAYAHAVELGSSLLEAIAVVLREELGDAWHVEVDDEDDDDPLWFTRRDWLGTDGKSASDRYRFIFNMKTGPGGEYDDTWLSSLLNAGPHGASVAVYFSASSFGGKRRWSRLVEDQKVAVAMLLDAGFKQDSDKWIYFPFRLDPDLVVKGYEAGDMPIALKPASDFAAIIGSAVEALEALVARDRVFE